MVPGLYFTKSSLISPSSNNYPYKAYIDDTLKINNENSPLQQSGGYYKDTGGLDSTDVLTGSNAGLSERYSLISSSRSAHFCAPLKSDLCTIDRWILPDVDIAIRLWQTSTEFRLVKPATIANLGKVVIEDISFLANKITVHPAVKLAHERVLMTTNAKYPFIRSRVHSYNISSGATYFRQDNIFQNEKPDRVVIGMVSSAGYQGSYVKKTLRYNGFRCQKHRFHSR